MVEGYDHLKKIIETESKEIRSEASKRIMIAELYAELHWVEDCIETRRQVGFILSILHHHPMVFDYVKGCTDCDQVFTKFARI